MQRYTVTTLDGGERIVTERVRSVRSVAIGIWIGAGGRDERAEQAGISHFIEHLLFKGSSRYSGVEIAQVFDGLGGELNAATAKEYTVLYARVLDAHLETALDVMADMLLSPSFDPDELAGRARGRARGDRDVRGLLPRPRARPDRRGRVRRPSAGPAGDRHRRRRPRDGRGGGRRLPRQPLRRPEHRRRRGGQPRARAAGAHDRAALRPVRAPPRPGRRRAAAVDRRVGAVRRGSSSQGVRAVPRLPRRHRPAAIGQAPVRRLAARLDAGRLGVVPAVPGDPRAAGDGVLGVHLRLPVRRHRHDRRLRRHPRGQPRRVHADRRRAAAADRRGRPRPGRAASAPRRTSRAASCSRWSRPATGPAGSASPC